MPGAPCRGRRIFYITLSLLFLCTISHPPVTSAVTAASAPDDPLYKQQWGLTEIEAPAAWAKIERLLKGRSPTSVTVAVIDSGVDFAHPDLQGRLWPGRNLIQGVSDPEDVRDDMEDGHGTHIAGIIAAVSGNQQGVVGVAGGYPIKVLPVKALAADATGNTEDVALALRWAVDWRGPDGERVRAINLSLGERLPIFPFDLAAAVGYALEQDVLIVGAAGNDGGMLWGYYPAAIPGVLAVGASRPDHTPSPKTNRGVPLYAPGEQILSTLPGARYGPGSGTSFAAPFVTAAAALLWSVYPEKSRVQVLTALIAGQAQRPCTAGICPVFSLDRALQSLSEPSTAMAAKSIRLPSVGRALIR